MESRYIDSVLVLLASLRRFRLSCSQILIGDLPRIEYYCLFWKQNMQMRGELTQRFFASRISDMHQRSVLWGLQPTCDNSGSQCLEAFPRSSTIDSV